MENLTKHWKSLSLSNREGPGICLKKEQAISEHAIAARFLTKRPLNIDAIANTFTPLWRTKSGFKVKHIEDHVVLFSFENKADVDRIIAAEPWSFDKHSMVLSRYNKETTFHASDLTMVTFWVQIYDIPIRFRNKEIAEQICESVGTILYPDGAPECDGGSFIRVRVKVDISQPLCRGKLITLEDGKDHWVSFKYERLANLCYWCGCLTHTDRDCKLWFESEGSLKAEDQQFGPWLRAPPFLASRKKVVSVPGFYEKKSQRNQSQPLSESHAQPQPKNHQVPVGHSDSPYGSVNDNSKSQEFQSRAGNPFPVSAENATADLPLNLPSQPDFEELIKDIDRDICRFDSEVTSLQNSNASPPAPNLINSSPPTCHPGPAPNISLPSKRRALDGAKSDDNSFPTAAADLQSRRAL
ncbi:uncharacterized protein LOC136065537 [Quercus suber]|uniref:uncharacterized protein LOC136065537 n=1 Tax=Quercus suber TaxID=58331 RepID=UPI0032DF7F83